jgi:hypothetical protein
MLELSFARIGKSSTALSKLCSACSATWRFPWNHHMATPAIPTQRLMSHTSMAYWAAFKISRPPRKRQGMGQTTYHTMEMAPFRLVPRLGLLPFVCERLPGERLHKCRLLP